MSHIKSLGFSKSNPGFSELHISIPITTTAVAGAVPSSYTAFPDAFSEAPKVIGVNPQTSGYVPVVLADENGVTVHAYQPSTGAPAATTNVEITLEGRLA